MSKCQYGGPCINLEYPNCNICCKGVTIRENAIKTNYEKTQAEETARRNIVPGSKFECIKDVYIPMNDNPNVSSCCFVKGNIYTVAFSYKDELCILSKDTGSSAKYFLPSPTRKTTWQDIDNHFKLLA